MLNIILTSSPRDPWSVYMARRLRHVQAWTSISSRQQDAAAGEAYVHLHCSSNELRRQANEVRTRRLWQLNLSDR
ncbi:hypothetical protein B0O80DRAFT_308544 [Mortierella sp. GBAus27b]|nr:hypothetical protein B0O80DRAFT_308544 [Mortierella sp. GBAus27b]